MRELLTFLEEMSPAERKVHFLEGMVASEQYWLQQMLGEWKVDRSHGMGKVREQRKRVQLWTSRLNQTTKPKE